jgi:hypothetical protein
MSILEAINLDEFVPIVVLIFLLEVVGNQMIAFRPETRRWALRLAAAAFIGYALAALGVWPPHEAWDVVAIVMRAMLAGGLVLAISKIALTAAGFLYDRTIGEHLRRLQAERQRKLDDERWQQEHELRVKEYELAQRKLERPKPAPPPPPPDRDAIAAQAKARYRATIAIIEDANFDEAEREAAIKKAKQQYLRALDGAMK